MEMFAAANRCRCFICCSSTAFILACLAVTIPHMSVFDAWPSHCYGFNGFLCVCMCVCKYVCCLKYYSMRVFKRVSPSHDVPTFTLSCTKGVSLRHSSYKMKKGKKERKKKVEMEAAFSQGLVPLPPLFPHAEELFVNGTKVTWETLTRWCMALPGWKNTPLLRSRPSQYKKSVPRERHLSFFPLHQSSQLPLVKFNSAVCPYIVPLWQPSSLFVTSHGGVASWSCVHWK